MSNPLISLKKKKKPPLYLPGMPQLSPTSQFNLNPHNNILTPIDKFNENDNEIRSSPISSFSNNYPIGNKMNESPLSSRVPFKTKIDDSDLIDEYTTKMAVNNLKKNLPLAKIDHTPTDMDLMQIMMGKIKATETRCAFLEKQSREKDKKISILEEKLDLYKNNLPSQNELIEELEKKNRMLRNQIFEMENFLSDYGLKWIGENNDSDDDINDIESNENAHRTETNCDTKFTYANKFYHPTPQIVSKSSQDNKFECNYDKIVSNIKELNLLTDHNEPKIVNCNNRAKFETADSINLTLYSNGIFLFNGPFRSFEDSLTRKFVIDIMDGYFPSELQTKYPDGVSFNLIDKRDVSFKEDERNSVFKSKGYRLGSAGIHSARYKTEQNTLNKETQLDNSISVNLFLNKLPNSIIKNGKLIDIRNDLNNLIKGQTDVNDSQSRAVLIVDNTLNNQSIKNSENVATLKVKSLTNESVYFMLKMNYTDTIKDLKDIIKSQRKINGQQQNNKEDDDDFDLASMYPRKMLNDLEFSLEQCELVPNSNILIIPRQK